MSRTPFPNKVPQPMPGNVRSALQKQNLMHAYLDRPAYQKDDYLKWLAQAAGPEAKQKRLDQMLDELEKGGVFKGEPWTAPEKPTPAAKAETAKPAAAKPTAAKPAAGKPATSAKPTPGAKPGAAAAKPAKASAKS